MVYLAHRAEDGRTQTVLEHLTGTAALCSQFAAAFGAADLGSFTGMAHDIGKYSAAFQKRINGSSNTTDHATAGAYECFKRGRSEAAFCVAGHHGGLPDGGTRGDNPDLPTFLGRMNRANSGGLEPYAQWSQELTLPAVQGVRFIGKSGLLDAFFFTRMLYSCLVDADYLDTEQFMQGEAPPRGSDTTIKSLWQKAEDYFARKFSPKGTLNRLRCEILEECIRQGEAQKPGLFTLTVPIGGGKTTASLAFALRHACTHHKKRIIYVIPYTSIIEQTAKTFRKILGDENVLEHHFNNGYDTGEKGEASPETEKLLRATENWDMPVIVTTSVQFFESLYANRSSRCRKLHNLADSVVIFDEAQMLPIPYLRPCVSAIAQLTAHYGVSAVLCTATQPALSPLFREFLPDVPITELCPGEMMENPIFKRVSFQSAGLLPWTDLTAQLRQASQVLCIVNSCKNAQTVYEGIHGEGSFHLSTLMTPRHRTRVLEEIRQRLEDGRPCRVVSTSLIEAGVDVDFPLVFREESGLDSILQAAGRCNREGKRPVSESIVTVFQSETEPPKLFSIAIGAAHETMDQYADFAETEAISNYFDKLLDLKGSAAQDQKNILPQIMNGDFPFRTVAERFRLIEENTYTVYIPNDDNQELIEQLRLGYVTRQLFRNLGQDGVSVYLQDFQKLDENGALELLADGSAILLDPDLYMPNTGLTPNVERNYFI